MRVAATDFLIRRLAIARPPRAGELPMVKSGLVRWRALWQGGLPPRSVVSLIFALTCVAIATIVRIGLGAISPDITVFAPYYSATLVAALVGGARAGFFAAASGALAGFWLFVPRDWKSGSFDEEQLVSFVLFALSSMVIIWAANSYRDLLWRLREEQNTRQLLNYELAHRIKNTLAIVQAVVGQTLRDQPVALGKLNDRIAALAGTNDLLIKSEWRGASLQRILVPNLRLTILRDFAWTARISSVPRRSQRYWR
jgi:K+-sensing histidine kinase KdpD